MLRMSQDLKSEPKSPQSKGIAWGWIVAGLLVTTVVVIFSLKAMEGMATYFMDAKQFSETREDYMGRNVKILGIVQEGSLIHDDSGYRFVVEHEDAAIKVSYASMAPDTFKEGAQVVVEGRVTEAEVFVADKLMAKCASKYEVGGMPPLEEYQGEYQTQ